MVAAGSRGSDVDPCRGNRINLDPNPSNMMMR